MAGFTPRLPLFASSTHGSYHLVQSLPELVKQNFKMLMLTMPEQLISEPEFGVGLPNALFEQDSVETREIIVSRIRKQVDKYMNFLEILDIAFAAPMGENTLGIKIVYNIRPLQMSKTFKINFKEGEFEDVTEDSFS